jgi:putative membrane protein
MTLFLWLYVGKPSSFYTSNGVFHAKIGLFLVIALISIIPTIFFFKNRNIESSEILVPKHILLIKHIEVTLIFVLALLAVFMALIIKQLMILIRNTFWV